MYKVLCILEEFMTFLNMVLKFPLRFVCKRKKEHDWHWYGGGFLFTAKYTVICNKCGMRSKGDLEDLEKKDFDVGK